MPKNIHIHNIYILYLLILKNRKLKYMNVILYLNIYIDHSYGSDIFSMFLLSIMIFIINL